MRRPLIVKLAYMFPNDTDLENQTLGETTDMAHQSKAFSSTINDDFRAWRTRSRTANRALLGEFDVTVPAVKCGNAIRGAV